MIERERYNPAEIEPKWQRYWEEHRTFRAERHPGRPKKYVLDMFPYPSGDGLHVGHPEGYTATDIVCRYSRMKGIDVLHPMGWDAFGLPAEQHAIRTGTHPRETTLKNIQTFRRQLKMLGFSYDWSREIDTTDPKYVRWTQWIFLKLFEKGLAFQQSDMPVNWCPELGTVLANDEVGPDGKSVLGGFPVEKVKIRQWSFKITQYADRLLAALKTLDWPESTIAKQTDWIGRSEGALVKFQAGEHSIDVFTTRIDTLFGATYVVLAPEHKLVSALTAPERKADVDAYVAATSKKNDIDRSDVTREKTGVALGTFAINPINGEKVPVWIGDYVIGTYGTGAVMAVPAHDERDHAFAKKYALAIRAVITPNDGHAIDVEKEAFTDDGKTDGMTSAEARKKYTADLAVKGQASAKVTYKLRDWVFSRQRYWGEPIPIYFPVETTGDPRKGAEYNIRYDQPIPLEDAELPLTLPDLSDYKPGTDPAGPLARAPDWRFFQKDGKWFARETNTMPQWAGSCWYYLRFLDPKNDAEPFSKEAEAAWMPVDLYVGGGEHSVLHLLYARFWHEALFDLGIVKDPEPFMKLVHQGMILGADNQKMSKTIGNVVNPDHVVKEHGADALRAYEMFMGPLEAVKPWQTSGIEGVRRFLDRAFLAVTGPIADAPADAETKKLLHKTIKKVGEDIESLRFNTAISAMMILVNRLRELETVPREAAEAFALILSPFAPHLGEELWERLGHKETLAYHAWPAFDPALVTDDTREIGVQVNGKVRGAVTLAVAASQDEAVAEARKDPKISALLEGKTIKKIIYVPGKILNLIVG
ncbi:MAG TPA: leucine--tRNA ligase [Polyangiaceae bacterium]|jgi:leucyl-tRNA synthetase|nr:leucine--tRNA ligase [Polyangiaceae bacterium]